MTHRNRYVFVLWGAQFDEAPATVFISELRTAGVLVKVVGLHGQHITGAHGVSLKPDIYLDKAIRLASRTACLIIPTTLRMLNTFSHDPRLSRFLAAIRAGNARILIGGIESTDAEALLPLDEVEVYPLGEEVFEFARGLGQEL